MDKAKPVSNLHYRYVIFMLLIAIVFLITDRWTGNSDFTQYLSNAATMTSLLLGVVAIFYSFISNSNMSNSLGSITEVSKDVKEVGIKIAEYHESSGDLITASTDSIKAFESVSKEITGSLKDFHGLLKDMDNKNHAMRGLMESFPSKFEKLEDTFKKVADQVQKQKPSTDLPILTSQWNLHRFIKRSSHHENLATYACILYAEHGKTFDTLEFCKRYDFPGYPELNSFLRCLDSAGLLSLVSRDSASGMAYTVTVSGNIKSAAYEKLMLEDFKTSTYREHIVDITKYLKLIKDDIMMPFDNPSHQSHS